MQFLKLFVISLMAVSLSPSFAKADKILFMTPTRIQLDDEKRVEIVNVTNLSETGRAYKISTQDLIMTRDGVTTPVDNFEYSAKRMIRFVPREFELKPGGRQTIRIMSRIGGDVADGEYHTHIRFLEDIAKRNELNPVDDDQTAASIDAPLSYEALIPATLSKGNVRADLGLKDVTIKRGTKDQEWIIDMLVTRQGNGQGIAFIDTKYTAPDGQVFDATPRRTVYIYREIDERVKDIKFFLPEGAQPGGNVTLSLYDSSSNKANIVQELSLPLK